MADDVVIVDYGAGNISSVRNALDRLGARSRLSASPSEILAAERIIFPGVGSFGYMMERLRKKGLDEAIVGAIAKGTPFLGICLGLQALFESSEESPGVAGLGVFKGKVIRFSKGKVPQVGWNRIIPVVAEGKNGNGEYGTKDGKCGDNTNAGKGAGCPKDGKGGDCSEGGKNMQPGLIKEGYAYFVNSYFVVPDDLGIVAATTDYYGDFASAVRKGNVTAVQFHPERSGEFGLDLLRRWLEC
ncbi:MAG: imidazole glycerol phosphate synthase subunit HisH [Candidatus Micrarchaeia archaeon]|jgi:imidazoleglycerol phosphate synthase glutamine amidotransferase subunit HisH